jgi:hypothetical protein
MDKRQLQIRAANPEDRISVEQVLVAVAARFGLVDNSITSRVPDIIRSYVEKIGAGFGRGARVVGDSILVDFNPCGQRSKTFSAVMENIVSELQHLFGDRLSIATSENYVEVSSTLPESPEAREFHRKMF